MERSAIKIRPLAKREIRLVERHINFDWAAPRKHRERLARQQEGHDVYLVAWLGGLPVGHVLLQWQGTNDLPSALRMDGCPNVEDLFVSPSHRSRGIGSRLLGHAEKLAIQMGYSQIGLGVSVDNPRARSLYDLRGYRDAAFGEYRTSGRYSDRDGREQQWEEICKYMVKRLDCSASA